MYKILSSLYALFCPLWLGYVFFGKSLALTNLHIFQVMMWAFDNHPNGIMMNVFFVLAFLSAATLMIIIGSKSLLLLFGKVHVFTYIGDELLNRYKRYVGASDPSRTIVQLPKSEGARLQFSYPTRLDLIFNRQPFLGVGEDTRFFSHLTDAGLVPAIFLSIFFYFFLTIDIVILHHWAHDLMMAEARDVTPMDSFIEFIVILSLLLSLNGVLLLLQYIAYKIKSRSFDHASLQQREHLSSQVGDKIITRLLENSVIANTSGKTGLIGNQAAYYLVEFIAPNGLPITACFQFGFSRKHQKAVERFNQQLHQDPHFECVVTDHMTLRPTALLSSNVNWFES